jgi:hypothetical protein
MGQGESTRTAPHRGGVEARGGDEQRRARDWPVAPRDDGGEGLTPCSHLFARLERLTLRQLTWLLQW